MSSFPSKGEDQGGGDSMTPPPYFEVSKNAARVGRLTNGSITKSDAVAEESRVLAAGAEE